MKALVIFSDLDGTLLDQAYSFTAAETALERLQQENVPLVICSSKTKAEILHYREELANSHPFIVENGGAIFIPHGYFHMPIDHTGYPVSEEEGYIVVKLGAKYVDLRKELLFLRFKGFDVIGFGDMTVEEIADYTGLDLGQARMAKEREFDEPFQFRGSPEKLMELTDALRAKGLRVTQGRLYHILGNNDKGMAVWLLSGMYRKEMGSTITAGIGDSPNDIPMLEQVDQPIIVQGRTGTYDPGIRIPRLWKAEGVGPAGWNSAVETLLEYRRSGRLRASSKAKSRRPETIGPGSRKK